MRSTDRALVVAAFAVAALVPAGALAEQRQRGEGWLAEEVEASDSERTDEERESSDRSGGSESEEDDAPRFGHQTEEEEEEGSAWTREDDDEGGGRSARRRRESEQARREQQEREDRAEREERERAEEGEEGEPEARPARRDWRRLSPRWFWTFFAVGAGIGAAAAISGGLTLQIHTQYMEDQNDSLMRQRGLALQLATNVLAGVAGGMGLAAVITAILTDWRRPRPEPEGGGEVREERPGGEEEGERWGLAPLDGFPAHFPSGPLESPALAPQRAAALFPGPDAR